MPSSSSRRNLWPSHLPSVKHSARSSTPCGTGRASARTCGCLRGQRLRRFADHVTYTTGEANGHRVRQWFQAKKAGWYAVLADPQMPVTSTLLDQAHNAIDRKLFAMKGFHHPRGSQAAFLTGLAHFYNLIPYQRRAQTGCSTCKSSPREGIGMRLTLPTTRLGGIWASPHGLIPAGGVVFDRGNAPGSAVDTGLNPTASALRPECAAGGVLHVRR